MTTKAQQKKNRIKWIAALRSGKYKQATGELYKNGGYCCLGVLCDVLKVPFSERMDGGRDYESKDEICDTVPPPSICEKVGLRTVDGTYLVQRKRENGEPYSLATRNDSDRWSFKKIAALIEREPKGMFGKLEE